MSKLPSNITISHTDYKVVDQPCSDKGQILYNACTIIVNTAISKEADQVDTVLHEILHGIHYHYDIGIPSTEEEHVVAAFADGLTTVFKNNPDLIRYIKEQLK